MESLSEKDKTEWFKNWFDQWYLFVYQHRDQKEAADFIDNLPIWDEIASGDYCLDLGCGTGRHTKELVRHGLNVVGLDLSMPLLQVATEQMDSNMNSSFVRADIRKLPTNIEFSLVVCLFTSFGYFKTDLEHLDLMKNIGATIKQDGHCILDLPNPNFVFNYVNNCPESNKTINSTEINEQRRIDYQEGRVVKKISIVKESMKKTYFESVRLFKNKEIMELLRQSSISSSQIWGDYDGSPYHVNSPRMIHFGIKIG